MKTFTFFYVYSIIMVDSGTLWKKVGNKNANWTISS